MQRRNVDWFLFKIGRGCVRSSFMRGVLLAVLKQGHVDISSAQ